MLTRLGRRTPHRIIRVGAGIESTTGDARGARKPARMQTIALFDRDGELDPDASGEPRERLAPSVYRDTNRRVGARPEPPAQSSEMQPSASLTYQ